MHCRKNFEIRQAVLTKSAPPNLSNAQYLFQISRRVPEEVRGCFVYCEFYIDVFFAVNLLMNFWTLCLANLLRRGTASPWRAFWGAFIGAAFLCGFWIFAGEISTAGLVIFYSIAVLAMIYTGCGFQSLNGLFMAFAAFFGASFLLGGILLFAEPFLGKRKFPFLVITTAAYLILYTGIKLCKYLKGKRSLLCEVQITQKDRKIKIKGLYDTGNRLRDTGTGKPVCVMEYSSFLPLLDKKGADALLEFCKMKLEKDGWEETEALKELQPRFLFYTSVGRQKGLLPVVCADCMTVYTEEGKREVRDVFIGLSRTALSADNSFQMIINPGILKS